MTSTTLSFLGDLDVRRALEPASTPRIEAIRHALADSDEIIVSLASIFPNDDSLHQPELTNDQVVDVIASFGATVALMGSQAAMQGGTARMMSLIHRLRAADIAVVGAGEDEAEARAPYRISLGGDKDSSSVYIMAAFRRSSSDAPESYLANSKRPGVASTRLESVSESILAIRRDNPNAILVVVPDWSGLGRGGIARKTRLWSLSVLKEGADYVLGHGSYRELRAKLQGTGAALHSLGQVLPEPGGVPGRVASLRWLSTDRGEEGSLSISALPGVDTAVDSAAMLAPRRLVRRWVRDLLALDGLGRVIYHGDVTVPFEGFDYRARHPAMAGKFFVLMDSGWTRFELRRYRQFDVPLATLIKRGKDAGVQGFVINRESYDPELMIGENVIVVDEVRPFLAAAVTALRNSMAGRLVAITGTAGKSSTKGMTHHLLQAVMPNADLFVPDGNQNLYQQTQVMISHIYGHEVALLEVSASRFYTRHNFRVSPDVAVITNIGESHLELFGTVENVARIKSTLFERLPEGGTALMSDDIAYREIMEAALEPQGITAVTYGASEGADIRLTELDASAHTMRVSFRGRETVVNTGGLGIHMLHNSLAGLGVVDALGHDWVEAAQHIESFQPIAGRGRIHEIEGEKRFTIIDESYNANPSSMRASLAALLQRPGQRIAVLGDMLEMGELSNELHLSLIEHIATLPLTKVYCVGPIMAGYAELLPPGMLAGVYHDTEGLAERLHNELEDGDVVMLKASNGIGLGSVVSELTA